MTTLIREAASPSPLAFPSLIPPSRLLSNRATRSKNRYKDYLLRGVSKRLQRNWSSDDYTL
jgi:hypothetical protein